MGRKEEEEDVRKERVRLAGGRGEGTCVLNSSDLADPRRHTCLSADT